MEPNPNIDYERMEKLQMIRRSTWEGGLRGLVFGSIIGLIGFMSTKYIAKSYYTKNYLVATSLTSACFGSFLGSLVYGRRSAQEYGGMNNIFRVIPPDHKPKYSERVYNDIMHSQDAFERREQAIKQSREINSND